MLATLAARNFVKLPIWIEKDKRLYRIILLLAATVVSSCSQPPRPRAADCASAETLASYPHGAWIENLAVLSDGRVLFTNYMGKDVNLYAPGGAPSRFASLDAHPVSVLPIAGGFVVAAHGQPFTAGPAFLQSNKIIYLDAVGAVTRTVPAPEARFLNGMETMADGSILIADSVLGRIWRLDVASGTLSTWLDAPELRGDETGKDQRPGANGVKRVGDALFVSNSYRGKIYRIGIDAAGNAEGPATEAASPEHIDDFVVDPDGGFIVATQSASVVSSNAGVANRVILPEGADGSTAIAFADKNRSAIYVATTGSFFTPGSAAPALLLRVALPGGETMCPRG